MSDKLHRVMISSTYRDLTEQRVAVRDAALGQNFFPDMMEYDPAKGDQTILASSFEKVDQADAYVLLISNYRYGQIIPHPTHNPDNLSVTELEFIRAEKRGIPICAFLMDENTPINAPPAEIMKEAPTAEKLAAFRKRVSDHSRITATFTSTEDLKTKVTATLARLKPLLASTEPSTSPTEAAPPRPPTGIPAPPAFHAQPPYIPGYAFQGRARELGTLRSWATSPDPVLVFEAIGGMGKSMVTWEWVTKHAASDRPDWAGRLWYSFYERGADMRDFCVTALSYITNQPPETFRNRPTWTLTHDLVPLLRARPFLLVLDGLERVLVAYHRSDAAQVQDQDVEQDPGGSGRRPRDCIRPDDRDLLSQLCGAGPSKILITSRLLPSALVNAGGQPIPGVRHEPLSGLDPPDAEALLRSAGVKGDGERMRRYLDQRFGCHPLIVGIVGGLVANFMPAPGDFDRWVASPQGGAAVNLADPGIVQRRTHILKLAFDGLDPQSRELMARIAMIANAVKLDVLQAINPARPPPPEVVEDPGALDVVGDGYVGYLRRRLADAKAETARADLEHQIRDHQVELTQRHEAAVQAYATYQTDLTAWQQLATVRDAPRWLDATLKDLVTRGLLQWDRPVGTFDLHPVVRGYAVGLLDGDARARSGQHVADYFAARPKPAYQDATGLQDLADPVQVVRALNLAGKTQASWDVLDDGLREALLRLELHHERLALMQPLFPDGWSAPPGGVDDPGLVAHEAAIALSEIGAERDAVAQFAFSSLGEAKTGPSTGLCIRLRNHSITLRQAIDLPGRERLLALARSVALAANDDLRRLWCDLYRVFDLTDQARLTEARALHTALAPGLPETMRRNGQLEAEARHIEAWLLFQEGALTAEPLHAAISRTHALGQRASERNLHALAGQWHQSCHQHQQAIDVFSQAIAMAHEVNLRDTTSEARRGLSLCRLGRVQQAQDAAASAERAPPHAALATLYLALNQPDQARDHALKGFRYAWANGPPYTWHWQLEECRAVLKALNEPEPVLPPFDPAKHPPFPWEADIHRMLAEHTAKQGKKA